MEKTLTKLEIDLLIAGRKLLGLVDNMRYHADLSDMYIDLIDKVKNEVDEVLSTELT